MGKSKSSNTGNDAENDDDGILLSKWKSAIISILEGEGPTISSKSTGDGDLVEQQQQRLKVKKLRKLVVLSLQLDDDENDKGVKKSFKHTIQTLEMENKIHLDEDGHVTLIKKKKKNNKRLNDDRNSSTKTEKGDEKKKKKQNHSSTDDNKVPKHTNDEDEDVDLDAQQRVDGDDETDSTEVPMSNTNKKSNVPCSGNPKGITRLFLGNLSFNINEVVLEEFLPGLTHVKWITDKTSGKFYGSAFVEMLSSQHAANAVSATKNGQTVLGRPIKINYAPALPGETWPPEKKVITGGASNTTTVKSPNSTGETSNVSSSSSSSLSAKKASSSSSASAGGVGLKGMGSVKPENCCKLFIGNLSYEITDEIVTKFFASIDVEIKAVRWIHHKDTGDFKGVGFVEFWNTEACEKAATLNGKNLLSRPIRIDWTD